LPPRSSTLNFPVRDDRANGFYVRLKSDGSLAVVYESGRSGSKTHFHHRYHGYFLPGP